jgi:hypothetical protein
VTRDPKEFRLYPRKPRQRIRDELKAWSIAFKRVMRYARMSRKKRHGTDYIVLHRTGPSFFHENQ